MLNRYFLLLTEFLVFLELFKYYFYFKSIHLFHISIIKAVNYHYKKKFKSNINAKTKILKQFHTLQEENKNSRIKTFVIIIND